MPFIRPNDHEQRMAQMRQRAAFELGDPSWAGVLFAAYEDPDRDAENLLQDMADSVR